MPEITALIIAEVVVASFIAMIVRLWDEPATTIFTRGGLLEAGKVLLAALIGVSLVMWALLEEGIDPASLVIFASLVGTGTLGMEGVRALITAYKKFSVPPSSPGPPT